MGKVYAEVEIVNTVHQTLATWGYMSPDEVRRMRVKVVATNDSPLLYINEEIREILQLPVAGRKKIKFPDGQITDYELVGPVELKFKNRSAICTAIVIPGQAESILGWVPLQQMDFAIDLAREKLIENMTHSNFPVLKL